ncbi:MAG: hypothetical protein KAR79_00685 [Simkaniaceae bacterium]|nr:hypothetical protein [Simkaniaceae bacterium]
MSLIKKILCLIVLISTFHVESLEMIAAQREGDGVGYKNQYSKFSLYHAFEKTSWQPFIDARYLLLNHGKNGANLGTGLGYQFEKENRLTGYAYFDLTESKTDHYFNQITAGLSYTHPLLVSGKDYGEFTCYFNGYFPIKNREKNVKAPSFAKFKGNHLIINQTDRLALTGTNLELGYLSSYWNDFNIYVAGSGYYFEKASLDTFGGYGKLRVTYNDLIHAEVMVSGDRLFGTNVSGTFGIRIPLDCKGMKAVKTKTPRLHRLRPVERFEPMILDTEKRKVIAKNKCGKTLNYIFVNNLCGSCGTFESPFGTLLEAQNASTPCDTIYVFRGDGTTTGMDMGVVMQENQTLAGSGSPLTVGTTLGPVTIPKLTELRPVITNTTGNGITLAINNTINGIIIDGSAGIGIVLDNINPNPSTININCTDSIRNTLQGGGFGANGPLVLNISNSNFSSNMAQGLAGASLQGKTMIFVNNSDFINNITNGFIWNAINNSESSINLCNSRFLDTQGSSNMFLVAQEASFSCIATSCQFNNVADEGVEIFIFNDVYANLHFRYCEANSNGTDGFSLLALSATPSSVKAAFDQCSANSNGVNGFSVETFAFNPFHTIYKACNANSNGANGFSVETNAFNPFHTIYKACNANSNQQNGFLLVSPNSVISGRIEHCTGTQNSVNSFSLTDPDGVILISKDNTVTMDL